MIGRKLINIKKQDIKGLLVHLIMGIIVATAIFLVSEDIKVKPEMAFLYILVAESYVVISNILLLTHKTYGIVNSQQDLLSGQDEILSDTRELIRRLPEPLVNYIKSDEKKIFELLDENKKKVKHQFYGIWCVGNYDQNRLLKYYDTELDLYNNNSDIITHRLINTETINRNLIKEHLMKFSDAISRGKYIVSSTNYEEYEIVICFEVKEGSDNTLAVQLLPDRVNNRVDLAIFSFDRMFLVAMKKQYDWLEKSGKKLNDYWDANHPESSIKKWFESCDQLKASASIP